MEVVVRIYVGVEPRAGPVHRQLANDSPLGEQVQGVVDRGLGNPGA